MKLGARFLILVLAVILSALPSMAQDIGSIQDFVAKGHAGSLTNAQIDQYMANWTEEDWHQFYAALAEYAGFDDPEAVAAELVAEDRAKADSLRSQYSAEIPRTHASHPSMRLAHYYETDQYTCDNDSDVDYLYMYYVSAASVLNMEWYSTNSWIGGLIGGNNGTLKAIGISAYTQHMFVYAYLSCPLRHKDVSRIEG